MFLNLHLLFFLFFILPSFPSLLAQSVHVSSCPLNVSILNPVFSDSSRPRSSMECHHIRQGLRLLLSDYLRRTGYFFPPANTSESCWQSYQSLVPDFDIRSSCGFQTAWISQGCMNLTTKVEFEALIPNTTLDDVVSNCNQSLQGSACASCTTSLSNLQTSYLTDNSIANVSDCSAYPSIYAAAVANYLGPTDEVEGWHICKSKSHDVQQKVWVARCRTDAVMLVQAFKKTGDARLAHAFSIQQCVS